LSAEFLHELARQVRQGTIQLLQAFPEKYLTWAPPGTSNHALWHAGHAVWLLDALGMQLLTGRSELPPDWEPQFGMNCEPVEERKFWPTRAMVIAKLREQYQRFVQMLESVTPEQLTQHLGPGEHDTVASRIIHGLHDEARHQGEMYLLFKMTQKYVEPPR
jgi:hypothetical protein